MPKSVLVAGIGNIFLGDDGFGVEVVKRLQSKPLPEWVRVVDFGVRGIHLVYDLFDKSYATVILIDAAPRGGEPGDVQLLEPDLAQFGDPSLQDPHAMTPDLVLHTLRAAGQLPERTYIIGCEPACTEEGIGLSGAVSQAVGVAVRMVYQLIGSPSDSEKHHA